MERERKQGERGCVNAPGHAPTRGRADAGRCGTPPSSPHPPSHPQLLHEAEKKQKMAERKDYYKILGVDREADIRDIKRAYKKAAVQHHPDKAPVAERAAAEDKFKEVYRRAACGPAGACSLGRVPPAAAAAVALPLACAVPRPAVVVAACSAPTRTAP